MGNDEVRRRLARSPGAPAVTAVLAIVGMNASFMQTLVIPIQGQLPALLDSPPDDTAWVVTAALLGATVFTPISGRLGDLFGKRRILLALLGILVLGSVIAALSTHIAPLIVGRVFQGMAVGTISLGISILRDVLHPDRMSAAIALLSATLGIGGALGLPLSAIVSEHLDWHAIFWMAALLGTVSLLLVLKVVPVSTLRSPGRFDPIGAIGLAAGLSGLLLAITKGTQWGWDSPATLGCGIGGIVVLVLWTLFELRHPSPLVDLRVAVRPAVLFTNLASVAMGFALFGGNVAMPQLLEQEPVNGVGLGLTLLEASLVLVPSGLVMMIVSPLTGKLIDIVGARILLFTGAVLIVVSYVLLLLLMEEVWQLVLVNVVIGVGIGLGYAAMPTLIMHAVPATDTAAANGLNALMRSLGTTVAAACVGAVLAHSTTTVGTATAITLDGFQLAFVLGGLAAVASAVLALLVPRRSGDYGRTAIPDPDPERGG